MKSYLSHLVKPLPPDTITSVWGFNQRTRDNTSLASAVTGGTKTRRQWRLNMSCGSHLSRRPLIPVQNHTHHLLASFPSLCPCKTVATFCKSATSKGKDTSLSQLLSMFTKPTCLAYDVILYLRNFLSPGMSSVQVS